MLKSLFSKFADLKTWNFIKKRLQHRCFLVNIAKILRTIVFKNICQRLLLNRNKKESRSLIQNRSFGGTDLAVIKTLVTIIISITENSTTMTIVTCHGTSHRL